MALNSWTKYKLSDLIASKVVVIGDGYRAKNSELCPSKSGLPFARAGNINSGFQFDAADYLAIDNVPRAGEKVSQPGDVLFTSKGTVGRVAFVSEKTPEFVYSPQLTWWRVKDTKKIEPRFLYYWMHGREFYVQINGLRGQTDMADYVSLRDQRQMMHVTLPPLDEQKAIAHILGTLDDKIELNQQMNRTLEAIARVLFKSWFIDFDPVRAKMDGRQPAGMDAETAALFPAEFEDSAIGKIPKGWEIKPFGELLDLTIGGDWGKESPDEKHTQPIAIIRGTDIASVKTGAFSKIPRRYTTPQKLKSRALSDGDIIIEVSGGSPDQPTGRSCYITGSILEKLGSVVVPASFCRLFRPKNPWLGIILKLHLEVLYDQGGTWVYQNQSTGISNFQTQYFLANELVIIPPHPIQKSFFEMTRAIVDKQYLGEDLVLSKIRDTLLPKLLSGEIRVNDAEKIMAEVA